MESDYDQKFEDMKKYIPFLENMIKRLESTNAISANPRQAQLDKIRSLRDLLLDKKKRMKMENLIKCEQVLINLYAKVEQRDTLPKKASGSSGFESFKMENNSHLEIVRNKLKRVSKIQDEEGTLPEIVRASDIEDVCTAGSVEPALFQRRPHKKSPTLSDVSSSSQDKKNTPETSSTRKYTRVLVSPEPDRGRSASQESSDTVLFSRRSPRRSPKRSSSFNRKESRQSTSESTPGNTKDLNITLNVPEESLNSLNTKDILSRIITCNDNDVDIDTLRGLRTQILSELKQTGANDDISDLILKSYAGKTPKTKKKEEIEEGELSDSESETIENIYGSLVLVDKDKSKNEETSVPEKDQPRKIQICLVINAKDSSESSSKDASKPDQIVNDECALEMFSDIKESKQVVSKSDQNKKNTKQEPKSDTKEKSNSVVKILEDDNVKKHESDHTNPTVTQVKNKEDNTLEISDMVVDKNDMNLLNKDTANIAPPSLLKGNDKKTETGAAPFKANFYKPLHEEDNALHRKTTAINKKDKNSEEPDKKDLSYIINTNDDSVEIPLLNEPVIPHKPVEKDIDSQIDILQALKNEILADNILSVPSLEVATPPLHQPKLIKVAGVQGITTKKRISIEKYKEKTTPVLLSSVVSNDILNSPLRDDNIKKQSLKLTEKECERFNFPTKININDDISSEEEGQKDSNVGLDEVYKNFAPKSPDNDETRLIAKTQPVIIPVDPVKTSVASLSADIDMRTLPSLSKIASDVNTTSSHYNKSKGKKNDAKVDKIDHDSGDRNSPLIDPRTRKDLNQPINWDGSKLSGMNIDTIPRTSKSSKNIYNAKVTSSRTPNSISFDISPNRQRIESDIPNAPILNDVCSQRNSENNAALRKSRWSNNDQDLRNNVLTNINTESPIYVDNYKRDKSTEKKTMLTDDKDDDSLRAIMPLTPLPVFGWPDNLGNTNKFSNYGKPDSPTASVHPFGHTAELFGITDCPMTPSHPFGRIDCPATPIHPFGRTDCPPTPSHPFGRTDCPATPIHPFGRADCPATPSHPFGRTDCPATPSHPFGRTDCPSTPIHPFGRLDCPATPSHPFGRSDIPAALFGRSDCPTTPSHPFGRLDGPPSANNPFPRIDFPGTPNHPYGISDCPTTPSHPFGRSDCPPTPSHPFGRLDCPPTPSHPFGMSECSKTPSHPFGRVDSGVKLNYFNRTEHSQNISLNKQFSKDPRLNRRSEYEPRSLRDERNHGNYNDRGYNTGGSYQKQNRNYSKSDSYTNYDKEFSDRRQSRTVSRSERSFVLKEISRDNERDQSSYSERASSNKVDRSRRRERDGDDRYRRDRSGERSQDSCDSVQTQSRDRSLNRNHKKEIHNDNRLSIKPDAGKSFTIDTSVNSTFQDLLKKKGLDIRDTSFDSRRSRAASVGRSKESYFNKSFAFNSESATANNSDVKSINLRRASSVGRDLHCDKDNRSYQEIKTVFQKYKSEYKNAESAKDDNKLCASSHRTNENHRRNKIHNDNHNASSSSSKPYSPRRNYRDPRMRRDFEDKKKRYGAEKNKYGFSYSGDNIAKGVVLHSGYGVKNYKIPKIKRPDIEKQTKDKVNEEVLESGDIKPKKSEGKTIKETYNKQNADVNKDISDCSQRDKIFESDEIKNESYSFKDTENKDVKVESPIRRNVDPDDEKINNVESKTLKDTLSKQDTDKSKYLQDDWVEKSTPECSAIKSKKGASRTVKDTYSKQNLNESKEVSHDSPTRRITRSSKKLSDVNSLINNDIIRLKRNKIIDDFSSEEESSSKDGMNLSIDKENSTKNKKFESNTKIQSQKELKAKDSANDNEIFFDNVSDPVIDNINDLIDDLDNHINSSGFDTVQDFTKDGTDDSFKNKEVNLYSPKKDALGAFISKNLEKDVVFQNQYEVRERENKKGEIDSSEIQKSQGVDSKISKDYSDISSGNKTAEDTSEIEKQNSEVIDSTTGKGSMDELIGGNKIESIYENIATSPADSTNEIIQNKTNDHIVPDSTNEVHSEMNSIVSSSHNSAEVPIKDIEPGTSGQESLPVLDSIGSLLSILQDKSKIHQLLNMLGEQSGDNDKIKRKLEKLSEIVSDDEEDATTNTDTKDDNVVNKDIAAEVDNKANVVDETDTKISECDETCSTKLECSKSTKDDVESIDNSEENCINDQLEIQNNKESLTEPNETSEKVVVKKVKAPKKGKGKITKPNKGQRVTRAAVAQADKSPAKKTMSRELLKLREDIKEMFLTDEMLNSTGIRMCRLAKLVDEKSTNRKEEATQPDPKPVVVLEKFKNQDKGIEQSTIADKSTKKKPSPKSKRKISVNNEDPQDGGKIMNIKPKTSIKNVLVSKSKKPQELDPYEFETDSVGTSTVKESDSEGFSDTDNNSLASSLSFGSSELLADLKNKTKRKRRGKGWQTGIIKPKNKKKKQVKIPEIALNEDSLTKEKSIVIPDQECFIDKYYCFQKNVSSYSCRLCEYTGDDIILHYKQQHPHTEIPLSRMNLKTAKEAIEQCQEVNFPAISKISTDKYVCRFCFKEFSKNKTVLESFFWHIVSVHTGEYKHTCSKCDPEPCHFNLDIPPPPKENKGQLIGYLCSKCNFTQVSLENLKTHVIGRHNDEQTDVYTINLSAMSRKTIKTLAKHQNTIAPRQLRSSNSNRSLSNENVDDSKEISTINESIALKEEINVTPKKSIQSKIAFEPDENIPAPDMSFSETDSTIRIKQENYESDFYEPSSTEDPPETNVPEGNETEVQSNIEEPQQDKPDDILDYPHFKISYKESGVKEYVCCINGTDNHYRTSLMISMKKHVQLKHSENWDGYCFLCKVIIKPPGKNYFKDCLQHFLDRHIDEFPVLETVTEVFNEEPPVNITCDVSVVIPRYINVRPLEQLVSDSDQNAINDETSQSVPIIESVVSLNSLVDIPQPSPDYISATSFENLETKQYKYEEWQEEVISKKHRVVLNAMMTKGKIIKVYKCTGRFCSFTSDSAEDALLHATTHQRIGGEGAMNCAYCDFDALNNGIDLVMHVFKAHGNTQYACGLCFYRGLASQLVKSHMSRKHPNKRPNDYVLHTNTDIKPVTEDSENILSREVAVPTYCCGQTSFESEGGVCNFRTYTPTQLCEHLQQRHQSPYPCNMCATVMSTATDLVNHMKEHGFRLYQCTFCVFGADNEKDMLDHASVCHPMRLPQAYLRLITNKDGNQQLKVLPRVYLNKCKVPTVDVSPDGTDDPVREAERCIELEKLIGHVDTTIQITSVESTAPVNTDISSDDAVIIQHTPEFIESTEQALEPIPEMDPTPLAVIKQNVAQIEPIPRVIKTEPDTEIPSTSKSSDAVVYCLDSDEEDPTQRVIYLSDEEPVSTTPDVTSSKQQVAELKKVPMTRLYMCPTCKTLCRNTRAFKRHFNACNTSTPSGELKCPHEMCTIRVGSITELTDHYVRDHSTITLALYVCGMCSAKYKSLGAAKQHMKAMHKVIHVEQSPETKIIGENKVFIINAKIVPKPSATVKRFGPQDIHQLPISPILESLVYCSLCEFNTKVRLNMVRHLQLHTQQEPVPQTAPVNPVPHLETNERHFDKMVNLASSSIINRVEKPTRAETSSPVTLVPAETANLYPKYVPDRQRYTCGAKGCSYISVDEAMFRCHWDTLHSTTNDYHCVHCPSHQHLDPSRPLTSARIIGHLKMHDGTLYACSACPFYHHKRNAMDKHLAVEHKDAQMVAVRLEGGSAPPVAAPALPLSSAPTMDLKPWQCGLCKFKSMLRPEVVEHCAKVHLSKMQYRCNYCPFRTSTIDNVTKHQLKSHPDKKEDVFYYYYREGSIPDEDGTPRWVKQNLKSTNPDLVVKSEVLEPAPTIETTQVTQSSIPSPCITSVPTAPVAVDLKLVKREVEENEPEEEVELSLEDLCKKFGEYCEPKGTQYLCPLCTVVVEDTAEAMQSHLYEELQYRKWGCGHCSYKAFHKTGLNQHMTSEHRGRYEEPIELQPDVDIEKWVQGLLDYQKHPIEKQKERQTLEEEAVSPPPTPSTPAPSTPAPSTPAPSTPAPSASIPLTSNPSTSNPSTSNSSTSNPSGSNATATIVSALATSMSHTVDKAENYKKYCEELELTFGPFGSPRNGMFCCPRCNCTLKEEKMMKEHLDSEMTKIRWGCSHCIYKAQIYHEAQFHCKTMHLDGARPVEAVRNVALRASWVKAALRRQKLAIKSPTPEPVSPEKNTEVPDPQENSLLVVRYEERVLEPDDTTSRKRIAPADSDEEKLVIDESAAKKKLREKDCPHCDFTTKWNNALREHILRHYNLKPNMCGHCKFMGHRYMVTRHLQTEHPGKEFIVSNTPIPDDPPIYLSLPKNYQRKAWEHFGKLSSICLHCERAVKEKEVATHEHENREPAFGKKGKAVVKCGICSTLHLDYKTFQEHHNSSHADIPMDYCYCKLDCDPRESYYCDHCNGRFVLLKDLRSHHYQTHMGQMVKYSTAYPGVATYDEELTAKRKNEDSSIEPNPKRVARKSTTKLPFGNAVAKKSTTKLPFNEEDVSLLSDYSFYGTKPTSIDEYANVTTLMPFCNTMVPFTIKKLSEIIKIEPIVRVKDVRK